MKFQDLCEQLEQKIQNSYLEGVTLEQAEKLAGEFLYAQMAVSTELKKADLNSRMHKNGVKTLQAMAYRDAISTSDKKPTEEALKHAINTNDLVKVEQEEFDAAEVERDNLSRYYNIFREAHIHFRGIAKGKFE